MSKIMRELVSMITSVIVFVGIIGAGPYSWLGFYQPMPPKKN